MDLTAYINSGAIECYLLGLSNAEEEARLEEMRQLYPELDSEISVVAYRLELAALAGGVTPPAQVWESICEQVQWPAKQEQRRHGRRGEPAYTVINLQQPAPPRVIQVSIWWRCAFIALCMLVMALLATSIYFYRKYHELEERMLSAYPASQLTRPSTN
ncbi:hypothetical protein [Chitinophaga japonensis]|uniref:Uncharacterized protein n=1 Tax=Chitinophaga japonensis TaxID=104662 RepID=A0A562TER9_CHIJA|nr:hypothetical protein [Chitinophaga japonensis]TWI91883.1 hypothetical protein LX66_1264 [Chitinophaga japonensis]